MFKVVYLGILINNSILIHNYWRKKFNFVYRYIGVGRKSGQWNVLGTSKQYLQD